jgi:hypothetical protein
VGECRDGRCFGCGYQDQPVCATGDLCRDGSEPYFGWCRHCGNEGEVCCKSLSILCKQGLKCKDSVCQRPSSGGGGGSGEQWKTCSGQPYTWSRALRPVYIEHENGCIGYEEFDSNDWNEAFACARAKYGTAVIDSPLEKHIFAVTCTHTTCNQKTYFARNYAQAKSCAEYEAGDDCSVADGNCP